MVSEVGINDKFANESFMLATPVDGDDDDDNDDDNVVDRSSSPSSSSSSRSRMPLASVPPPQEEAFSQFDVGASPSLSFVSPILELLPGSTGFSC